MRFETNRVGRAALLSALLGGSMLAGSQAHAADAQAPAAAAPDTGSQIVVTAQKRAQYLQDVPISLEAFGSKKLEENQITSFDDYAKLLPSVSFQSFGPGQSQIYFRGVSSGSDANGSHSGPQPTSAIYVDEIPLTTIGGAPDLQLTAVLPIAYDEAGHAGLGNIELAAKYKFLHQDDVGFDVSIFP